MNCTVLREAIKGCQEPSIDVITLQLMVGAAAFSSVGNKAGSNGLSPPPLAGGAVKRRDNLSNDNDTFLRVSQEKKKREIERKKRRGSSFKWRSEWGSSVRALHIGGFLGYSVTEVQIRDRTSSHLLLGHSVNWL